MVITQKKTEHLKIRFRLIKLVQNTKVKQVAGRGFYAKKDAPSSSRDIIRTDS